MSLAKNVVAFTILSDGIPIIYAGQEQHYSGSGVPYDREAMWLSGYNTGSTLYTWTAMVNQIRNQAIYRDSTYVTYKALVAYSDSSTIVMRKGNTNYQIVGVFSNQGSSGSSYTLTLTSSETGFAANQAVMEVMSCTSYTTDSSGNLFVAMAGGVPRVFYPTAQLGGSGICNVSTTTSSTAAISTTSKTSTACTSATSVAVTFKELKTTTYGQTVKISGNITALGNWNTANAVSLSASSYTSSNPLWQVTITLPAGQAIQYKYILVSSSGAVTWEADPNHSYTVPTGCAATATVSNTWQ